MAYAKRGGVKIRESTRAEWPIEWRESYDRVSSVPYTLHGAQVGEACFRLPKRLTSFGWPQLFCRERGEAVEEIKKRTSGDLQADAQATNRLRQATRSSFPSQRDWIEEPRYTATDSAGRVAPA